MAPKFRMPAPKRALARVPSTQRTDAASAEIRQTMRGIAKTLMREVERTRVDDMRVDGWENAITRLGEHLHDKRLHGHHRTWRVVDLEAEDVWRGDAMFGRAVEEVPNQIMRAGVEVQVQQEPNSKERGDELRRRVDRWKWMKSDAGRRWWNERIDSLNATPEIKQALRAKMKADLAADVFPDKAGSEAGEQSKEMQEAINERLEQMGVLETFCDALKAENGYGGAAIFPIIEDGEKDLSKPLNHDRIKSILGLDVLTPLELVPFQWYADPVDVNYGRPQLYWMQRISIGNIGATARVPIHESRLITFPGVVVSRRQLREHWGWGDSLLVRMRETLRDFQASHQGTAMLLQEFGQAVMSIEGLSASFASKESTLLADRATAFQEGVSIARIGIIDAKEKYERIQVPVAGLSDLLDRMANWLAATVPMPVTILMGQAPTGLNAAGSADSSMRSWFDQIDRQRKAKLAQRLRKYMLMEFHATEGPTGGNEPDQWSFKWGHLWQPSESEQAQARYVVAQADQIYIQAGVLMAEEVAKSRFGGDAYSPDTQLDSDIRDSHDDQVQEEAEAEAAMQQAKIKSLTAPKVVAAPPGGGGPKPGGGGGGGGAPKPSPGIGDRADYSEDQPRDQTGKWGAGGGGGKSSKEKGAKSKVGLDEKISPGWTSRVYSFGKDPGEKALGSWNLAPGNKHLEGGQSLTQAVGEKGWVAGRDHIAKELGLDKLSAPAGHEIVYRLSHEPRDGLAKHNGGNLEGVIQYADEHAERGIEHGQVLTAYSVRLPDKFAKYTALEGGRRRGDGGEWVLDEWNEGDHPRDERGRFGEGGGGGEKGGKESKGKGGVASVGFYKGSTVVDPRKIQLKGGPEHATETGSRDRWESITESSSAAQRKEELQKMVAEKTPEPPKEMAGEWTGQDQEPDDETWGKYMEGEKGSESAKTVDPARAELHQAIKDHFNEGVTSVPADQTPVAIFNMGAPASGKGHMNRKFKDENVVLIDSDEVKSKLPEYRDGVSSKLKSAAMNVHEESSTIAKQMRSEAIADRKNFLFDGTGKNVKQYAEAMKAARDAGYHVELRSAYKDREDARAKQESRAERTGRWVKPSEFESGHDVTPRNFQKLAKSADRATLWYQHPGDKDISNVWEFNSGGSKETKHDPGFVSSYTGQHHQVDRRDPPPDDDDEEEDDALEQVPSPTIAPEQPHEGKPSTAGLSKAMTREKTKVPKGTGAKAVARGSEKVVAREGQIPTTGSYQAPAGGTEPPPQPPVKAKFPTPRDTAYKIPGPEVPVGKNQGPQSV